MEHLALSAADPPFTFRMAETKVLTDAYGYALSYLEFAPNEAQERREVARLTVLAAAARRRLHKGLESRVDALALAAEIVGMFRLLRQL